VIEILSKPVDRIGIGDIQSLIALKVLESEQIEFKESLSTKGHSADPWMSGEGRVGNRARDAVLEEATAFANAFGGALLLGIRESDAKPPAAEEIAPVPRCTELSERLKLMFRDCVEPPLPSIEIVGVPVRGDCGIVVIRVGKSRLAPHRVKTTLVCPVRRQDRCERMTMREIQDMTLNVSRGLDRLERALSARRERFDQEFQRLFDPENAIGVRATALPVGDEVRLDRVYSKNDVIASLLEPWHRVQYRENDECVPLAYPFQISGNWQPMIRAARVESIYSSKNASHITYKELHCDGLVELGFLDGTVNCQGQDVLFLTQYIPTVMFANLVTQAHRMRDHAGVPAAEYAAMIEIHVRGCTAILKRDHYGPHRSEAIEPSSIKFPLYPLGDPDEIPRILNLFDRDFWNSLGKDVGAEEGALAIENWPDRDSGDGE
jgi:hypothetical protein